MRQFKERIKEKTGIEPDLQRLIYCGRVMNDEHPLSDYGKRYYIFNYFVSTMNFYSEIIDSIEMPLFLELAVSYCSDMILIHITFLLFVGYRRKWKSCSLGAETTTRIYATSSEWLK